MIKRILGPTDFSPDADAALQYAIDLANHMGAAVHLLHVVENPMLPAAWSSDMYTAEIAGLQMTLARDAETRLRRAIPCIAGSRFGFNHDVRMGPVPATIVQYACEELIDLIVMGTTGRTGLAHVLMGSVAERVVRTAPCPVLTLRAPARRNAVKTRRAALAYAEV